MSGIAVSDDAINLFYYMKAKSAYQWAMWGINGKGDEVHSIRNNSVCCRFRIQHGFQRGLPAAL